MKRRLKSGFLNPQVIKSLRKMLKVFSNSLINFSSTDDFNLYILGLNSKRRMFEIHQLQFAHLHIFNMQLGVYLLANNSTRESIYTRSAIVMNHYLHFLACQQVQLQK